MKIILTKKLKRFLRIIIIILAVISVILTCLYVRDHKLIVTEYEIKSEKITSPVRVALIADLHNNELGQNNSELINAIKDSNPDIIASVGDLMNQTNDDYSVMYSLIENIVGIAPVYCSMGNHELNSGNMNIIIERLEDLGATVLAGDMEQISVNGNTVLIGGSSYIDFDNRGILDEFAESDEFKLFLYHYPELYIWMLQHYDIDLILSGHTHGGQIRLPFVGGLFAPEQGLFPKYDAGLFTDDAATIVISKGLGSNSALPRINNPPELVIVDIIPAD